MSVQIAPEFNAFPKIPRLFRDMQVTEKLDGTNAGVVVTEDGGVHAQSRKRLITPGDDNYGFAKWVEENADELRELGPGHHYGEWWGKGIQRGYELDEKRFSLFNPDRYADTLPACCSVVPVLMRYRFDTDAIQGCVEFLREQGSQAAPGFMQPEGVVVHHAQSGQLFKALLVNDEVAKGEAA